ncbi:hypothetical protein JOC70_003613 [Clostridium pascui]|uniref:hypothetical protein n=1 Tax=Clostridium pascui TaxID=46609 RepID=UPI00195A6B6D|nr:hypothetical protein [Clostridium pascui]MBM7872065.1 hypothetical protein [Clostridium pascui]
MRESDDRKNITDGISFFTESDLFKKKENRFLLQVFGLSILLFVIVSRLLPSDSDISYFLSVISSVLIINGYNKAKKEDRQ